ncbi:hypothetical protein ACIQAL_14455 [Pseudomonas sp. NPDC088368]|jgi:hypothetical protein|uniref:hypothetical protein n=1 Tax=Pseudomonas sp. NPDC088368 TaxID=3364453 RepID=UPI003820A351
MAKAEWTVLDSVENDERNRCVDIFVRTDGSYGFEEFRFDPEDGQWMKTRYYADQRFVALDQVYSEIERRVPWSQGKQRG